MRFFKILALWGMFLFFCVLLLFFSTVMASDRLFVSLNHIYIGVIVYLGMSAFAALVTRISSVKMNALVPVICGYMAASLYHWYYTGKIDPWYIASYLLGVVVCIHLLKVTGKILNPSTTTRFTLAE